MLTPETVARLTDMLVKQHRLPLLSGVQEVAVIAIRETVGQMARLVSLDPLPASARADKEPDADAADGAPDAPAAEDDSGAEAEEDPAAVTEA